MPFSTIRDKKAELIRKAREGSVFVAPMSSDVPTSLTTGASSDLAALPAGYEDVGWTTTDGVSYGRETNVSEVRSFGSVDPTRADVTSDTMTMGVTMQETSKLALQLYIGADLSATEGDATTAEVTIEKPAVPSFRYYRVLGIFVDTDDSGSELYIARFMPRARITEVGEQVFSDGDDPIQYPTTWTGFEDSTAGYSHKWYFGGPGWDAILTDMGFTQAV